MYKQKRIKDSYIDKHKKSRKYTEIYVDDKAEALTIDPDDYIQNSKMYIVGFYSFSFYSSLDILCRLFYNNIIS